MSRAIVLRAGPVSARTSVRMIVACAALVVVCAAVSAWGMTLGSFPLTVPDIVAAFSGVAEPAITKVVMEWRAPRIVAALLFGGALGVAGGVFQSLTRNPLGSPDVIGFTTGSYTGVVVAMMLGATGYAALAAGALVGGLATAALVYLLAFRHGVQGFRLIIVGIAIGAFLGSVNTWFTVKVDVDLAMRAAVWGAGSLGLADWGILAVALPFLVVVALCVPAAQRRMRRLELGDDAAAMLGVPVERTKALLILLGVAATATVTAAAGPIAFVALAAPQIARRITGHGASIDLVGSALVGAAVLVAADIAAQHAIAGVQLPTGAVTVCVGGAYLLVLLARESRRFARGEGR